MRTDPVLAEIEAAYRARFSAFLHVAIAVAGDEQAGHDAVHDGFVRALRHRRRFRAEGSVEGWLWRIVLNEARRHAARSRTALAGDTAGLPEREPHPNGDDEALRVRALVAALPERQRFALFLRYYADLDYEAIAQALGVRAGTVAATLNHAHAALRRVLEQEVRR